MTSALATLPADSISDGHDESGRVLLADLAAMEFEDLTAPLYLALPDAEQGQVAVAAFQSTI